MQRILRNGSCVSVAIAVVLGLVLAFRPTEDAWLFVRIPGVLAFALLVTVVNFPPSWEKPERHRLLGWLATIALTTHVVLAAALEPAFWPWLSQSVPVELVAGLIATVALSTTLAFRRFHVRRLGFGALATFGVHRVAGTVACVGAGAHIALIAGMTTPIILLASASLLTLLTVVLRREKRAVSLMVALAFVTCILALPVVQPISEWRLTSLRNSPIDHAGFSHSDHGGYACTSCHHNFTDKSGTENCISCHKRLTTTETMRVDRLFHVFCSDCHRSEKSADADHSIAIAPIDHCEGCHATGLARTW